MSLRIAEMANELFDELPDTMKTPAAFRRCIQMAKDIENGIHIKRDEHAGERKESMGYTVGLLP